MGNAAGALGRIITKKARRFNVESRTEKYLEKNVKNPAPKPVATQIEIEQLKQEMPDLMEKIHKRNEELLTRLKDVYVSDHDPPPDKISARVDPNRPLPIERRPHYLDLEYGHMEPESVSPGRLSLKQALLLLSKHQLDKEKNNIKALALEFNLSEKDVGNFVDYFKVFTLLDNTDEKSIPSKTNLKTFLQESPEDKVPVNVANLPEETEKFAEAVQKRSDALNKKNIK